MNTSSIHKTATLALAAAKGNVDTPRDVSRNPTWNAPEKFQHPSLHPSKENLPNAFSNHVGLPPMLRSYVDGLREEKTAQNSSFKSTPSHGVREAAQRLAGMIPTAIASELDKISDHLARRFGPQVDHDRSAETTIRRKSDA